MEKKTYIDVVFIVPHSDIVEKSGFIQVHKGAWKQQGGRDKQDNKIYQKIDFGKNKNIKKKT